MAISEKHYKELLVKKPQNKKQKKVIKKCARVLAIDPGFGRCGWAIIDNVKGLSLVACDLIETDKSEALPARLVQIFDAIEYLVKKYKPTDLAIESLFWFKNQKTAMAVAQARGVIIASAQKNKINITLVFAAS